MGSRHEVDHLPEGELEVHLTEKDQTTQVAPPLRRGRHAEKLEKQNSTFFEAEGFRTWKL